jgi:hypothetical protein
MAGTFQNVIFFMIIQFTAQVGACPGKCPALIVSVEKYKVRGGQKTGRSDGLIYLHVCWFFRNFKAGKLEDRVQKGQGAQEGQK